MDKWESRLSSPDVPFAKYSFANNTRHFHLVAEPIKHKILDNLTIEALGYNGSTPGPVIVLKQGEWISLTVENRLDQPTALPINFWHGRRIDIEFISTNPGIWPINGTKTFHQSNNGETLGGMVTRLIYK